MNHQNCFPYSIVIQLLKCLSKIDIVIHSNQSCYQFVWFAFYHNCGCRINFYYQILRKKLIKSFSSFVLQSCKSFWPWKYIYMFNPIRLVSFQRKITDNIHISCTQSIFNVLNVLLQSDWLRTSFQYKNGEYWISRLKDGEIMKEELSIALEIYQFFKKSNYQ